MPSTKSNKSGKKSSGKTSLSVVGTKQAVEEYVFFYTGPLSECKTCKVKNICFGLTPNRMYQVKDVRDRTHDCNIFEEGVRVVEVEEIPVEYVLNSKKAVEGSVISLEEVKCNHLDCEHYKVCGPKPLGLKKGDKFKILEVGKEAKCLEGDKKVQAKIIHVK